MNNEASLDAIQKLCRFFTWR